MPGSNNPLLCMCLPASTCYALQLAGKHYQDRQLAQSSACTPLPFSFHAQSHPAPRQPRDFIQTKKLYEGKIAAVVQGYHAASGRPLALKVYNRARLDTMERFQVRKRK